MQRRLYAGFILLLIVGCASTPKQVETDIRTTAGAAWLAGYEWGKDYFKDKPVDSPESIRVFKVCRTAYDAADVVINGSTDIQDGNSLGIAVRNLQDMGMPIDLPDVTALPAVERYTVAAIVAAFTRGVYRAREETQ